MKKMIRQEERADYALTEKVIEAAFKNEEQSEQDEHHLVARIRNSEAFIPELSLVAIDYDTNHIIGHILLSKIQIRNENDERIVSLALAPVSVLPAYQNKGIGKALIQQALKKAKELGFHSVIVLGHPAYYPKFGFQPASNWDIKAPFEVPDEAFMAVELTDGSLEEISGTVEYSQAFFGD